MSSFFETCGIPYFVDPSYLQHGTYTTLDKIGFEATGYLISEDKTEFVKIFTGPHLYRQKNTLKLLLNAIGSEPVPEFLLLPSKIIQLYGEMYAFIYETYESVSDLFNYLGTGEGKLSNDEFKLLIKTFINAINWFSKNNLSHRDIKFENILKWKDGSFKLIDYGLIKEIDYIGMGGTAMYLPYVIEKLIVFSEKGYYNKKSLTKLISNSYYRRTFTIDKINEFTKHLDQIYTVSNIDFKHFFGLVYQSYFPEKPGLYQDLYTILIMLSMFSHNELCEDASLLAINGFLKCAHESLKLFTFKELHDKFYGSDFNEFLTELGIDDLRLT